MRYRGIQLGAVMLALVAHAGIATAGPAGGPTGSVAVTASGIGVISGHVVLVGGPHGVVGRDVEATVAIRNAEGRLVRSVRASGRQGFRARVLQGRYVLSVNGQTGKGSPALDGSDCRAVSVLARAGRTARVVLRVGCEVP